ncbi:hypothetical protein, partial [Mesorhizobium sp. M7A.F.Ca.CA.004.11.2.1]|uniref:hypothetical protein n=1 Tax=Mesorhizobium sp. M7A.F.Ca.CA.004.11.2.1 TaxID=2496699 RepID=UPI0019D2F22E
VAGNQPTDDEGTMIDGHIPNVEKAVLFHGSDLCASALEVRRCYTRACPNNHLRTAKDRHRSAMTGPASRLLGCKPSYGLNFDFRSRFP